MKISCEKSVLQGAITTALAAVSGRTTIPALSGLLLRADKDLVVCGYDMQIGIQARVQVDVSEPGVLVIPAKLLSDAVRRLPDDVLTLSAANGGTVRLTCGGARLELSSLPEEDFPQLPQVVEADTAIATSQGTLKSMIGETIFAVSTNEIRPTQTGALFDVTEASLTVVACDGFRLALRREPLEQPGRPGSFIVPGRALAMLARICGDSVEPVTLATGERHILATAGDVTVVSARIFGEFINYQDIITPKQDAAVVTVDPRRMAESVTLVSVVTTDKVKTSIRCQFDAGVVRLSAKTSVGEASDDCPITGDGGAMTIAFNNRYLLDALKVAPAERVRLSLHTATAPVLLQPADGSDGFIYLVLPVRIKEQ